MKPSELKKVIADRVKANIRRPVYIESSPGLGKTQIAAQVAQDLKIAFKAIHAPLMQPEDYGFPAITQDKSNVNFIVSKEKFPLEASDCPNEGILLIDELPQCDHSSQKILANLVHEREIHNQKLKAGWFIIATGNRSIDRAGASRLLSHLRGRVTSYALEASLDDWTQWALQNKVKTEVIAFIRFRPELLNAFDPQQEICPSPRSWVDGVSQALGIIDSNLEFETFKGDVGEGAAAEFIAFLKVFRKLPSPDAILLDPKKTPVPEDPATLYALCGSLAAKASPDNLGRLMIYIKRMPPEFGVLFIRDAIQRNPEIQQTPELIYWASNQGTKILI